MDNNKKLKAITDKLKSDKIAKNLIVKEYAGKTKALTTNERIERLEKLNRI